jgi:hypothetical protein
MRGFLPFLFVLLTINFAYGDDLIATREKPQEGFAEPFGLTDFGHRAKTLSQEGTVDSSRGFFLPWVSSGTPAAFSIELSRNWRFWVNPGRILSVFGVRRSDPILPRRNQGTVKALAEEMDLEAFVGFTIHF